MTDNKTQYYICVTPFFPAPGRWQGAYVLDQVKAISRNSGYEVIVFKTCGLGDRQSDYVIDGITVHTIHPLLMPSYILNGLTEGIVGRNFIRTLKKLKIDIDRIAFVHCHTANHAAFGFGVKRVNTRAKVLLQFHDLDPLTLRNGKWANKRWNRRYRARKSISALNRADMLVCISEPVRDAILAFPHPRKGEVYPPALQMLKDVADMSPIKPQNICILNNGVDTTLFHPMRQPKQSGTFRIGCIANFQELKDLITLVKAFNILIKKGYTNMRLSLLGSGETRPNIERYISENGLSDYVEWPREVYHDQLPEYYNTLDLFVLPSIFEGFGCVYTEAYACGVPFICCDRQGAAECIAPDERDKWLISPHDYDALARLIERQYRERNVQHLCKDYDIEELIKKFLNLIKEL